jgi:hypothetical protein
MAITLVQGKALPEHDSYKSDAMARAFWRLTFETGRKYISGIDAEGGKILVPHEREKEGYSRRLRMTKPRNHSGPIIRRYNNHVFRIEAQRPESESKIYNMLLADTDGEGNGITAFMSEALRMAQVERESYLMLDSTKQAEGEISKAQAEASGARPVIKLICPDNVLDWREYNGALVEVLVLMAREDGSQFARVYDKEGYVEAEIETQDKIKKVGTVKAWTTHGYKGLPVIRLQPFKGESQISPLAESQQLITNLMSWLIEEMGNVTFSQMVLTGVSAKEVKDVFVGNNRGICLPNAASSVTMIGADPAQAASIATSIADEQRELYRIAGVSSDDPLKSGTPESGIAKAFKHNDLSANLSALAGSVEEAENKAMRLMFGALNEKYPGDVKYPDEFDLPSIADDLQEVISVVTVSALPNTIKKKIAERFVQRHLSLDEEEQSEFESELESIGSDPLTNTPSGMQGT